MKILHTVEFYHPSIGGAQEVVRQISERLTKMGHDVTVATTKIPRDSLIYNGVKIKEFDISGNYAKGYTGNIHDYINYVKYSNFDIIMNYAAQQWATDLLLPILREIHAKKILVPCGYSGLYNEEYVQYYEKLKIWLQDYDATVYHSNEYQDIIYAKNNNIKKLIIIPNGADEKEFDTPIDYSIYDSLKIPKDRFIILSIGNHTGAKGHSECIKIFDNANIHNALLIIVGNAVERGCYPQCLKKSVIFNLNILNRIKKKTIIIGNFSRRETINLLKLADIFLFPSNVECSPIVLFEAMASSTPFVCSNVGNANEIIKWSEGGILIPTFHNKKGFSTVDIKKGAEIIEMLFSNKVMRDNLAQSGYNCWKNNFTWEKIAIKYEKLYLSLY
jgi:glycosyltransferase involved in cell wall biosynthesis